MGRTAEDVFSTACHTRGTEGLHAFETELVSRLLRHRLECAGQISLGPVDLRGAGGAAGLDAGASVPWAEPRGEPLAPCPRPGSTCHLRHCTWGPNPVTRLNVRLPKEGSEAAQRARCPPGIPGGRVGPAGVRELATSRGGNRGTAQPSGEPGLLTSRGALPRAPHASSPPRPEPSPRVCTDLVLRQTKREHRSVCPAESLGFLCPGDSHAAVAVLWVEVTPTPSRCAAGGQMPGPGWFRPGLRASGQKARYDGGLRAGSHLLGKEK